MAALLVIDPDDAIRESLRDLLETAGYSLSETASPDAALDMLRMNPERMVVLFDAGVPRLSDGAVTALAHATDPRLLRHAYICMTTSHGQLHADLDAELARLSVPIIEKPFDNDELLELVRCAATKVARTVGASD
jgi:DNA-binding NtrC family response regulator